MEFYTYIVILIILLAVSIKIVPQQQAWIIERFGKYRKSLEAGLHIILPLIDKVAYKHTLKERTVSITAQAAITKDNVTLLIDGIVYVKINNPVDASYGVEDPYYAVTQLAQTSMRSVLGKMSLDNVFEARETLNTSIVAAVNEAAASWGIQCMRHEIRDIKPPENILKSMEIQLAAERQKRAEILESEGKKQSMINIAEAKKCEVVLNSEAIMTERVNNAKGEAEAIQLVAVATAESIIKIADAAVTKGGDSAIKLRVAEKYIDAFKELAKTNNTMLIPSDTGNVNGMLAQLLGTYNQVKNSDNNL